MSSEQQKLHNVANWLQESQSAVAMTGAGISTESGIPDFRSPGGIWSKYWTVYFDEFLASADARYEYWQQKVEGHVQCADAVPNQGHNVLAAWERAGIIQAVITQNIDEFHQQAGSRRVLELHGTARKANCLDCGQHFDIQPFVEHFLEHNTVPTCPSCGGRVKHATVSFGQPLPVDVIGEADQLAQQADLMLAIGSSLVVMPAADLPRRTTSAGGRLVIINREETPLDHLADCVIHAEIGATLVAINQLHAEMSSANSG